MSQWVRVGKAKEAHGLKGELYILLFAKEAPKWVGELKEFALASADAGPFQVVKADRVKSVKGGLIVRLPGITDRTQAENQLGQLFYISHDLVVTKPGETITLKEIQGFIVRTATETVGPIVDFSSNGAQDLLVVQRGETRVDIPFIEPFITKIDFEKREVLMDLPEGLWDL